MKFFLGFAVAYLATAQLPADAGLQPIPIIGGKISEKVQNPQFQQFSRQLQVEGQVVVAGPGAKVDRNRILQMVNPFDQKIQHNKINRILALADEGLKVTDLNQASNSFFGPIVAETPILAINENKRKQPQPEWNVVPTPIIIQQKKDIFEPIAIIELPKRIEENQFINGHPFPRQNHGRNHEHVDPFRGRPDKSEWQKDRQRNHEFNKMKHGGYDQKDFQRKRLDRQFDGPTSSMVYHGTNDIPMDHSIPYGVPRGQQENQKHHHMWKKHFKIGVICLVSFLIGLICLIRCCKKRRTCRRSRMQAPVQMPEDFVDQQIQFHYQQAKRLENIKNQRATNWNCHQGYHGQQKQFQPYPVYPSPIEQQRISFMQRPPVYQNRAVPVGRPLHPQNNSSFASEYPTL